MNLTYQPYLGKTVIFCLPGSYYSGRFLVNFTTLLDDCKRVGMKPIISQDYSSMVNFARCKVAGADVKNGPRQAPFGGKVAYDYMMWIDSDIIFKPEHFFKLLQHDKDIVSGLYMMTDLKHYATVENWDEEYFKKHGNFPFIERTDWIGRKGLVSVDYTGFGWMLVRQGVFESIQYPWFRPEWKEFPFETPVREFTSEDVSWCHLAKKQGWTINVDPEIVVGHEKLMII